MSSHPGLEADYVTGVQIFVARALVKRAAMTSTQLCKGALALLCASLLLHTQAVHAQATAQDFPARAIRVIVPFSPGGAVDGPMRVIAQEMSKRMGQQITIDNRPGAGATIGSEAVAKAAPDGYTLLLASQTNSISATLYPKLAFDLIEDFAPITLMGREQGVLVVNPAFPARTLAELIAHVRQNPGKVDYASSGNGSGQHLFMALFTSMMGLRMNHIPYRGSGQATADVLGGQVQMSLPGLSSMLVHIRAGKLRPLAVSGTRRSPALPEVPAMDEAGVKGYSAYVWMGLMAPKGTPPAIITRLQREVHAALDTAEVKTYMSNASIEPVTSSAAEFGAFFRDEKARWAVTIKETNARID